MSQELNASIGKSSSRRPSVPTPSRFRRRAPPAQLREELGPERGVEHAVDEEVDGRVDDEAEERHALQDVDPQRDVLTVRAEKA